MRARASQQCALSVAALVFTLSMSYMTVFESFLLHYRRLAMRPMARRSCSAAAPASPDIVVYIPTPIPWRDRRRLVLDQFRRELHLHSAHMIFALGTRDGPALEFEVAGIEAAQKEAAEEENVPRIRYLFTGCRDYGDEPDNPNGTSATTCKVYEALRYIVALYDANPPRYVWRGADDAYVDLTVFRLRVIPALQSCRLFLGRLRFPVLGSEPDLELQQGLYSLYGLRKFGKYMVGMGYCMTWDVARFIGAAAIPPRLTWCEDIAVSHWLLFYDVDFVDANEALADVRMVHADADPVPFFAEKAVLLAHRMSPAQWGALARRTPGDMTNWLEQ